VNSSRRLSRHTWPCWAVVERRGGSYLDAPEADSVDAFATELLSAWGEPDSIVAAADVGFASSQLEAVGVWSYGNSLRSVTVRDNVVVSIQEG
jgi:hypothetical protein